MKFSSGHVKNNIIVICNLIKRYFLQFPSIVLIPLNLFYFAVQSRWDPDSYHDGFIFASAVAASEGKLPNRDFFALYGPLGPEIYGFWLRITEPTLLQLRVLTMLLLTVISLLILQGTKNFFGNKTALLLSLVWTFGNPLILTPTTPWLNIMTSICLIGSMAILRNLHIRNNQAYFFVGILLSCGALIRIHLLGSIILLLILLFVHSWRNKTREFIPLLMTVSLSLIIIVIIMTNMNTLEDYLRQSVFYASHLRDGRSIRGMFNIKVPLLGFFIIASIGIISKLKMRLTNRWRPFLLIIWFSFLLLFIFAGLNRQLELPFVPKSSNLGDSAFIFLKNLPYWSLFFFTFVTLIFLPRVFLNKEGIRYQLRFLLAFSSIFQLYPSPHISHMWFIAPVLIIGVSPEIKKSIGDYKVIETANNYILIPSLVSLLIIFNLQLHTERIPFKSDILKGMSGSPELVQILDTTLLALKKYVIPGEIRFECPRGLFSVPEGEYIASDENYVTLIPPYKHEIIDTKQVFYCDIQNPKSSGLDLNNYKVLFQTKSNLAGRFNVLFEKNR